ncbi:MAG: type II toxin-antitoxin system prevent-host-death family antitoxin [Firmicutes bacterium]|nr:type II toxin-antitoxin system prevent-host-death family antitoxin [Bacillota bacterium]
MEEVGVRKIKDRLSRYLKRVKDGEMFTITMRGIPVARLVPVQLPRVAEELLQSGEAIWRGGKPGSAPAAALERKTDKSLGEMVAEDRR